MQKGLFLKTLCAASLAVTAAFLGLFLYLEETESDQVSRLAVTSVHRMAERFNDTVETLGIDVRTLAWSPPLLQFIASGREDDRLRAQEILRSTSDIWKAFIQVRYIDETGQERIRVDRVADKVTVIPTDQLQYKSGRGYFENSVSLPDGSLYISRLDLNVENKQIEVPWKPMLRVAAPVYNAQGESAGIVVINVLADYLLNRLKAESIADNFDGDMMLLSEDGSWLFGAPVEKLWDFMFSHGYTLANEQPDAWKAITANESGAYWQGDTLYAYATVRPDRRSGLRSSFAARQVNVVSPVNYWKIVEVVQRSGSSAYARPAWWAAFAATLLVAAWVSWVLSTARHNRRLAELRERTVIARSREVLNQMDVFVCIWDMNGRTLFANDRYCRLVGEPVDRLVGQTMRDTSPVALQDALQLQGSSEESIAPPVLKKKELVLTNDGIVQHFLIDQFPLLGIDGKQDSQCVIGVEVTELKEFEASLILAKEEAIEATTAKSRFLANMSHELRTPLNAIIGYAEILDEEAEDDGLDEYRSDLQRILEAGRHLLSLINDILDLSKIEAGKMELNIETFSLESVLSGVITTAKPLIEKNGNKFILNCDLMDQTLRSDDTRLRQILLNLLSNAAKFSSDGEVLLSVNKKEIGGVPGLEMIVQDTGIGMSPEQLERLFGEFNQADSSISKRFQGTGLGLAICKRLAIFLGGDIAVESEEGVGSSFILWTPLDVGSSTPDDILPQISDLHTLAETQPASKPIKREDASILVIDDDANSRELLARYITSVGMQVSTAANGLEGIKRAGQTRPDAIVLDVFMDGLSGWEVLHRLKADADVRNIPIIMCSISDDQKKAASLGAVEMLTKPVNKDVFVQAVRRHSKGEHTGTILVVDDLKANRDVIISQLSDLGTDFIEAENGKDALEKLETVDTLHSVVLDLMMPEMDGFEFLEKFRSLDKWRDVSVFVLTAMTLTAEDRKQLAVNTQSIFSRSDRSLDNVLGEVKADIFRTTSISK